MSRGRELVQDGQFAGRSRTLIASELDGFGACRKTLINTRIRAPNEDIDAMRQNNPISSNYFS